MVCNLSATTFQKAKDLTAENKWREAYEALEEVRTDYRNYADAVQLREDLIANYRQQMLDEVSNLLQNGDISQLNVIMYNGILDKEKEVSVNEL